MHPTTHPVDELKAEHRAIETALNILENLAQAIHDAEVRRDADRLLEFLRTFVDTCHHGKEEHALFPSLEKIGVSHNGGPIGVMLHEHEIGRGHIRGMAGALADLRAGARQAADGFREHAAAYARLLRQHIRKEDDVLFDIAQRQLPEAESARLKTAFDRIEEEIVGHGKHEAYHEMLSEFQSRYGTARR